MVKIEENFDLTSFNTFGIFARARYFSKITSVSDLQQLYQESKQSKSILKNISKLYLGSGSNVLFVNSYEGLVLKNDILGISTLKESAVQESADSIHLKVGAGENWSDFVAYCLKQNWYGLENLSLIPGTVGAAPVQNIGAYGVEVKKHIEQVEYFDFEAGQLKIIEAKDCQFGYRSSVFKSPEAKSWFITGVQFKLSKIPTVIRGYSSLESELLKLKISDPSPHQIAEVVIKIRSSKLPDPQIIGNAGSFFKNPLISIDVFEKLQKKYPKIVFYPENSALVKLAAGWLIDQCGLKGYREGSCGVHKDQALVLVNYGGASGKEIFHLSEKIKSQVFDKFQVQLESEVTIL